MSVATESFIPQGTIIRVKRPLDTESQDTLLVSSKRQCIRNDVQEPELDYSVFQKLDTVTEEECSEANVKKSLVKNKSRLQSLKVKLQSGQYQNIRDKMRQNVKEAADDRRYLLTACKRGLNEVEGKASIGFQMFKASSNDDPNYVQRLEEVLSGVVEVDVDTAAELQNQFKNLKSNVITCNGIPMIEDSKFVYDIYYNPSVINLNDGIQNTFSFTNYNMLEYRDNTAEMYSDNESEDSNEECYFANDYGHSDYEEDDVDNGDLFDDLGIRFSRYTCMSEDNLSIDSYNDGDFDEEGNLVSYLSSEDGGDDE